jgi:hypothetical protein
MRHVHQYGQWDCWRQSLSTESRKLCGFLGEEFLHEVRIFRACCGEISNVHGNVYYIYRYMEFRKSNSYYIYTYIHVPRYYIWTTHTTYIQIFMLKSILSAWPATIHQRPRKAWGSYDNKRRKNVSCRRISSQNGALMSLIWPVEFDQFIRCGTHIFAGYAAMHIRHYICNQRHGIEDIYILYIYTWPNKPTCQPGSGGYGSVITYTKLMISQYFSCIWLFSRFLLYLVERNMCSFCPLFDGICLNF